MVLVRIDDQQRLSAESLHRLVHLLRIGDRYVPVLRVEYATARARELVDEALAQMAGLPESRALASMEAAAEFVLDRNW